MVFTKLPQLMLLSSVLLSGCSTHSPEWLASPTGAYCASGLNSTCLKALAEKSYSDATARHLSAQNEAAARPAGGDEPHPSEMPESKVAVLPPATGAGGQSSDAVRPVDSSSHGLVPASPTPLVEAGKGVTTSVSHEAPEKVVDASTAEAKADSPPAKEVQTPPIVDGSLPMLAFGIAAIGANAVGADGYQPSDRVIQAKKAGAYLNVGQGPITDMQLKEARNISDEELRAGALSGMLYLHSRSMSDSQVNSVLNELYALDKDQYSDALIVKLPGLLLAGDLERAKALRGVLLGAKAGPERSSFMLAYVAACYTMAGMKQDAGAIVEDAVREGGDLSADDQRLINLSISVSNGSYPMAQDFWDFKSDDSRLSAYLAIAVIARQFDSPAVAHRAVADAVRFIQKAGVKMDKPKALSQILAVSPGVI